MILEATIDQGSLQDAVGGIMRDFEKLKSPVEDAMAEKFFQMVRLNFGNFGIDRPIEWAPLSPAYAKRVGREHATLFLSGSLEAAIKIESNPDVSRVFVTDNDVPYALAHQYGSEKKNLPARPFFPIDQNGVVMPFTLAEVQRSANEEVARLLSN